MNTQLSFIGDSVMVVEDFTEYTRNVFKGVLPVVERSIFDRSEFKDILLLHAHGRGEFGERLVRRFALECGFRVYKPKDSSVDLVINEIRCEVKFARESEKHTFAVNQIRPKQDFVYVVCVFMRPDGCYLATVPKDIMVSLSHGQHGGNGAEETKIYTARNFDQVISELGPYMGTRYFIQALEEKR